MKYMIKYDYQNYNLKYYREGAHPMNFQDELNKNSKTPQEVDDVVLIK